MRVSTQGKDRLATLWHHGAVLTKANLKSRYRNSTFGYLWVVLSPLSAYLAQAYVFRFVFKVNVDKYLSFLLFGLLPWLFFSQTLEMVTTSFYHNGKLLKNVSIHPMALVISQAIDNLLNNLTAFLIVLAFLGIFESVPWARVLWIPIPYAILAILAVSVGFMLAAMNVEFFDVKFVLNFALGLLFFVTPILYPENFVPEQTRFLLEWNPLHYALKPFRTLLGEGPSPSFWTDTLISFLVSSSALLVAIYYWRRRRNEVYLKL